MAKIEYRKQAVKPSAGFDTIEDEADFWDTHSALDDLVPGAVVGVHRAGKTSSLTIRFEPQDIERIREQAKKKGIGPTTLARRWILEHLEMPHQR